MSTSSEDPLVYFDVGQADAGGADTTGQCDCACASDIPTQPPFEVTQPSIPLQAQPALHIAPLTEGKHLAFAPFWIRRSRRSQ